MKGRLFLFLVLAFFMFMGSAAAWADITTGLVGHWTLDETVADSSGNGNNGTLSGSTLPTYVSGVVGGGALSFNDSGYVDLGTNVLSGSGWNGNAVTVSAWIKPNTLSGYIVTHGQWSPSWDLILENGRISFDISYNNNNSSYPEASIVGSYPINTTGNYWTHVVATYTCNNGSGTSGTIGQMSLYINGVQDTNATINGQPQTGAPLNSGSLDTRIGARYQDLPQMSPSPFSLFSGSIDDVQVYSRALTSSDITALYQLGSVPAVPTDIYISQSGNGIDDGSSCSNSYPINWLNSLDSSQNQYPLSWDPIAVPGQIYPGVTVHLCGTISTGINILGSGTAGNPITFKFDLATSAKMSAPVFTTAIRGSNVSYITIDGCYGSEYTSGNNTGICIPTGVLDAQGNDTSKAIIENTNNGSPYEYWQQYCNNNTLASLQGPTYDINNYAICNYIKNGIAIPANLDFSYPFQQTNTTAVSLGGGSNNVIKNLTLQNLYIRTPSSGDPAGGFGGFVTQDEVEYSCPSSGTPTSCNETTPSGLNWSTVVSEMVNGGWATNLISTILQGTSKYSSDSSLQQDLTNLFGSNATALYIMNLFTNDGPRPGTSLGINIGGASNVLVQNNTIKMAQMGINDSMSGQQNVKIDSNQILGWNHGIEMGGGDGATLNGLIISNNRIDGMDVWENANLSPIGCWPISFPTCYYPDIGFHRNPIFIFFATANGLIKNIDVYNNHFGPGFNPQTGDAGTACIFFDFGFTQDENVRVFNNIFELKSSLSFADGWGGGANLFANNTLVGGDAFGGGGPNSYVYNNLKIDGATGIGMAPNKTYNGPNYLSSEISDYNLLSGIDPNNSNAFWVFYATQGFEANNPYTFAQWKTIQGLNGNYFDIHSLFGQNLNPYLVDGNPNDPIPDYHLQAWSPAINAGTNLSQFCNAWPQVGAWDGDAGNPFVPLNTLCQDKDGNARPSSGSWDIGAYYFQASTDNPRPIVGGPIAYGQSVYVTIGIPTNITLTGSDPNGDPLTYQIVTPPSHGTLTYTNGSPLTNPLTSLTLKYVPNSTATSDVFTFMITDTVTGYTSNLAAVGITVNNISLNLATSNSSTNFNTGSNIPLTAIASVLPGDNATSISNVKFSYSLAGSNSSTPIGTVTTNGTGNNGSQYNMTWINVPNGSYVITAQATESAPATDPNNGQIAIATYNVVVSSSPPNIASNLAGYWNFDEGTGATAKDCSALTTGSSYIEAGNTNCNGPNYGTLVNFSTWGSMPGALMFNGSQNQSVSAGTNNMPLAEQPITLSAWVYTVSSSSSGVIISRMDNPGISSSDLSYDVDWLLAFGSNNHLVFYDLSSGNTGLYEIDSTASIAPNAWHHVAVTFDGLYTMNFYIDGVLTSSSSSFAGWTGGDGPMGPISIGNGATATINGVRVYARTLAPQDVNELHSMGQAVTYNLTVTNDGNGTITSAPSGINCGSTCTSVPYNAGTVVTLTAMPASGYTIGWSANCAPVTGNPNACTITMTSAQTVTATFTSSSGVAYGDANSDGVVNIYDAELTEQATIGLPVAINTTNADVDGKGATNIYDAYLIAEYAAGLITKFPVQQ
jgi:hypothetical protein